MSQAARRAEQAAVGSPADAVVRETVEFKTSESADLSFSFLVFMVLARMIAALGILQDSQILIIGAMVVGPEFGPGVNYRGSAAVPGYIRSVERGSMLRR